MNYHILHTLRRLCAPALMLGAMLAAASCTAELSSEVVHEAARQESRK